MVMLCIVIIICMKSMASEYGHDMAPLVYSRGNTCAILLLLFSKFGNQIEKLILGQREDFMRGFILQ